PFGQTQVEVFLILRTVGSQDVQPFPTPTHADQKALSPQQPATIDQLQAPDRVAGIHEVAPRGRALGWAVGLVLLDELLLLVTLGLEEEARGLVKTASQTRKQPLGAAERVGDPEIGLNPVPDLARASEPAGLELGPEMLSLGCSQFAGIAPIMKSA